MFCQVLLAAVFAAAVFGKARSRTAFASFTRDLPRFGLPGGSAAAPVGLGIVLAEAATVGLLFAVPLSGFLLALVMLLGFSTGIAIALRRGERVPCRCFGSSRNPVGVPHLIRNGLLAGAAIVGALIELAWSGGQPETALRLVAAILGALSGLLLTRWDDLLFALRGTRSTHS